MKRLPILINIYGASGCGKSTQAMRMTSELKKMGYKVEYCREWVKEYLLENGEIDLPQKKVTKNQNALIELYMNSGADYIVCDSPLLLGKVYGRLYNDWSLKLERIVCSHIEKYKESSVNIFLSPLDEKDYQNWGRVQSYQDSLSISKSIESMMKTHNLDYIKRIHSGTEISTLSVLEFIEDNLPKLYKKQ